MTRVSRFKSTGSFWLGIGMVGCLFSGIMAAEWEVKIDSSTVIQERDLSKLLGGNAGFWYSKAEIQRLLSSDKLPMWQPGLLRIPGGSWGDEIYWNGNGVRDGKKFDLSKRVDSQWRIDYSGYKPGFRVRAGGELSDFHGGVDALTAHRFVNDSGSSALVTVNAGVGTPEMAAQWVRWANIANDFKVKYWEVGNELEGKWELGHFLPSGEEMTPEIYADRYMAFAKAMKAVDPTIKVGGPAASNDRIVFGDAMLEKAGGHVDFISYHTYPVGGGIDDPTIIFKRADSILNGVEKLRKKIKEKVPERSDQIEIGITEWHVAVHEGSNTINHISGPWCAKWIGRMLEAGVDFANIWDMFSTTRDGGHGVFCRDPELTPRGAFWAMALWNQHMSGTLLKTELSGGPGLVSFATRTADGVSLLLINETLDSPIEVAVNFDGKAINRKVKAHELSVANYLWDDSTKSVVWSHPNIERIAKFNAKGELSVPPLSALVLKLSENNLPQETTPGKPTPKLIAPDEQPADVPFRAWITLVDSKTGKPYVGPSQIVEIVTSSNLKLKAESNITMFRPAIEVPIKGNGSGGPGTITVRVAGLETSHTVDLKKVEERIDPLWQFDDEADIKSAISSYDMEWEQGSLSVSLDKRKAGELGKKNRLVEFKSLPNGDRTGVAGVKLSARVSEDLSISKGAKLSFVVQSKANHWIPIGTLPISKLTEDWGEQTVRLTDMTLLDAMPELYSLIIMIQGTPEAGSIEIDDIAFIVRK